MSFWNRPTEAAKNAVVAPMKVTNSSAVRRQLEHGRAAADQEHARRHHGGGMDQGGNRRRAFHRVRQPGVQAKLRRLAHRADEQQQAQRGQDIDVVAGKDEALAHHGRRGGEHRVEIQGLEHGIDAENAQREAEIADAVDDERLDRGGVGGRACVPEADQQIGRQAHAFPAEEQLQEIVGRHQHQHGEGEQRQIGEEARPVRVFVHVADGIEMHERRDAVTTTSITAVSVSTRSVQSTAKSPE